MVFELSLQNIDRGLRVETHKILTIPKKSHKVSNKIAGHTFPTRVHSIQPSPMDSADESGALSDFHAVSELGETIQQ